MAPPSRFPVRKEGEVRGKQGQLEKAPSTYRHMEPPGPEVRAGWQSAHQASRSHERLQPQGGDNYMSGALPAVNPRETARQRDEYDDAAFRRPDRIYGAQPHGDRTFQLDAAMDERYPAEQVETHVPLRTFSQASFIPQRFAAAPESRAVRYPPRDSEYFSNHDLRVQRQPHEENLYYSPATPARPREVLPQVSRISQESPFFTRNAAPPVMRTPLRDQSRFQPEQLVSRASNYRMAPVPTVDAVGQSLNSLSFINSPYTNENQPIYSHRPPSQPRPFSVTHRRGPEQAEPGYFARLDEFRNTADNPGTSRNASHLLPRHVPAAPSRNGRAFTRDDDIRLLGTIRGAKSGTLAVDHPYGRTVASRSYPPVVPFARNIGTASRLFSSGGRRTIRR